MTARELIRLAAILALPFAAMFVTGLAVGIIAMAIGWVIGHPARGTDELATIEAILSIGSFIVAWIVSGVLIADGKWKEGER